VDNVTVLEGDLTGGNGSFAVVVSRFNSFITERLLDAAVNTLVRHGVDGDKVQVVWVPGAFEIPLAARALAQTGTFDAIVALGAVIRGATAHFDYVAGECARGLAQVQLECEVPIGFGVLTVDTVEQAMERAGAKAGNRGADATLAALEMASLLAKVKNH